MKCGCTSERITSEIKTLPRAKAKYSNYYRLGFVVSTKNIDFVRKYVFPEITIKHKRRKLSEFFRKNACRL